MATVEREFGTLPVVRETYSDIKDYYKDNLVQFQNCTHYCKVPGPIRGIDPTDTSKWGLFAGVPVVQELGSSSNSVVSQSAVTKLVKETQGGCIHLYGDDAVLQRAIVALIPGITYKVRIYKADPAPGADKFSDHDARGHWYFGMVCRSTYDYDPQDPNTTVFYFNCEETLREEIVFTAPEANFFEFQGRAEKGGEIVFDVQTVITSTIDDTHPNGLLKKSVFLDKISEYTPTSKGLVYSGLWKNGSNNYSSNETAIRTPNLDVRLFNGKYKIRFNRPHTNENCVYRFGYHKVTKEYAETVPNIVNSWKVASQLSAEYIRENISFDSPSVSQDTLEISATGTLCLCVAEYDTATEEYIPLRESEANGYTLLLEKQEPLSEEHLYGTGIEGLSKFLGNAVMGKEEAVTSRLVDTLNRARFYIDIPVLRGSHIKTIHVKNPILTDKYRLYYSGAWRMFADMTEIETRYNVYNTQYNRIRFEIAKIKENESEAFTDEEENEILDGIEIKVFALDKMDAISQRLDFLEGNLLKDYDDVTSELEVIATTSYNTNDRLNYSLQPLVKGDERLFVCSLSDYNEESIKTASKYRIWSNTENRWVNLSTMYMENIVKTSSSSDYLRCQISKNGSGTITVEEREALTSILRVKAYKKKSQGEGSLSSDDILVLNPESEILPLMENMVRPYCRNNVYQTPPLVLIHFSDIHGVGANYNRIVRFFNKYKNVRWGNGANQTGIIADILNTGDTVESGSLYNNAERDPITWMESFPYTLNVIGNHDSLSYANNWAEVDWTGFGKVNCYRKFIEPFVANWNVVQPENAAANGYNYYYKDYTINGVRLIVLDCMFWDETQAQWLEGVLTSAKTNDLAVIIAAHMGPATSSDIIQCTYSRTTLTQIASTYPMPQAITHVKDFVDGGGEFVCWLVGHCHPDIFYNVGENPKQPVIAVASAGKHGYMDQPYVIGTRSQDAFNVFSVDRYSKTFKIFRVGSQIDEMLRRKGTLCYDYDNGRIVYNN